MGCGMKKGYLVRPIITFGVLGSAAFVVIVIILSMGLASLFSMSFRVLQPREPLVNGVVVYVERGGRHRIYIEDYLPPPVIRHEFVFINEESGDRVYSRESGNFNYSLGAVRVNNVYVRGTFGRLVAVVDLEPGRWMVEYRPFDYFGEFVWREAGNGFGGAVNSWMLIVAFVVFVGSLVTVIVLVVKKAGRSANSWDCGS